MKTPDHIQKAREAHHAALERLTGKPGLQTWRKLRRLEAEASAITLELCNGTLDQERCDAALDDIRAKVEEQGPARALNPRHWTKALHKNSSEGGKGEIGLSTTAENSPKGATKGTTMREE